MPRRGLLAAFPTFFLEILSSFHFSLFIKLCDSKTCHEMRMQSLYTRSAISSAMECAFRKYLFREIEFEQGVRRFPEFTSIRFPEFVSLLFPEFISIRFPEFISVVGDSQNVLQVRLGRVRLKYCSQIRLGWNIFNSAELVQGEMSCL